MKNLLKEKAELVYISTILEANTSVIILAISTQKNYNSCDNKPISVILSNFRPPANFI
jgi:hypothetical protein